MLTITMYKKAKGISSHACISNAVHAA